jgi:hypothetical protein
VIAGVVKSPIEPLARLGGVLDPLGTSAVGAAIREHVGPDGVYHVLGILSTVGWEKSILERVPRGENYSVVLIEQADNGGWRLEHTLPKKLSNLLTVFDPEEFGEKVSRTFYRIIEDSKLKIPGGFVQVDQILEGMDVNEEVFSVALKQVEQEDPRIQLTKVKGRKILKRDRY